MYVTARSGCDGPVALSAFGFGTKGRTGIRGRAAQGPSNAAMPALGQSVSRDAAGSCKPTRSLCAERRVFLFPRPSRSSLRRLARDRVTRKATHRRASPVHGAICPSTRGAAGAANRPAFRMSLRAKEGEEDRRALRRIKSGSDFARLHAAVMPVFAGRRPRFGDALGLFDN